MNKLSLPLSMLFLVLAIVFACLWIHEKNDKSELLCLAQSSISESCGCFAEYQRTGYESEYWKGVAAFRSFEQAYGMLVRDTNRRSEYGDCDMLYGKLTLSPGTGQKYIEEIIEVLSILSEDAMDRNGYLQMTNLLNSMEYSDESVE